MLLHHCGHKWIYQKLKFLLSFDKPLPQQVESCPNFDKAMTQFYIQKSQKIRVEYKNAFYEDIEDTEKYNCRLVGL